jgi:EAL domain-containing protein (putative c-di-GMP-specific phosphodiesterase class I)
VETETQREWLMQHHCHGMQGYLLGRPAAAADIEPLLALSADKATTLSGGE